MNPRFHLLCEETEPISELCFDPEELRRKIQAQVDAYNAGTGTLGEPDCPNCRGRGFTAYLTRYDTMATKECGCLRIRRNRQKLCDLGLTDLPKKTLAAFQVKEAWQRTMVQAAQDYLHESDPGWFLMAGQSGAGKTHLCKALINELLPRGYDMYYMSWRDQISRLKAMSFDSEARTRLLDTIETAKLLYIDDFFKTAPSPDGFVQPTAADINLAFEILNARYCIPDCITLISTELLTGELLRIDEAIAGRILERCGKYILNIQRSQSRNYRLRHLI